MWLFTKVANTSCSRYTAPPQRLAELSIKMLLLTSMVPLLLAALLVAVVLLEMPSLSAGSPDNVVLSVEIPKLLLVLLSPLKYMAPPYDAELPLHVLLSSFACICQGGLRLASSIAV